MTKPRLWTDLDTQRLRTMLEGKIPLERIAEAYGMTVQEIERKSKVVSKKPRKAPVPRPQGPAKAEHDWPPADVSALKRMRAQGETYVTIAQRLGLQLHVVQVKAVELGIRLATAPYTKHRWTEEETATLRLMKEQGHKLQDIAIALSLPPEAVRTKASKTGIKKWGKQTPAS